MSSSRWEQSALPGGSPLARYPPPYCGHGVCYGLGGRVYKPVISPPDHPGCMLGSGPGMNVLRGPHTFFLVLCVGWDPMLFFFSLVFLHGVPLDSHTRPSSRVYEILGQPHVFVFLCRGPPLNIFISP